MGNRGQTDREAQSRGKRRPKKNPARIERGLYRKRRHKVELDFFL